MIKTNKTLEVLPKLFDLLECLDKAENAQDARFYGEMESLAISICQAVESGECPILPILPQDLEALREFVRWDGSEGFQGSSVEQAILRLIQNVGVLSTTLPAGRRVRVRWVDVTGFFAHPLESRGDAAPKPSDVGLEGMVQLASLEIGPSNDQPWAVVYSVVFSGEGGQFVRDLYDFEIDSVEADPYDPVEV